MSHPFTLGAIFTLGLSFGCSDDPVVQEMSDWADAACACEDLDCVSKAADDLIKKGTEMGDKKVTQGEMDKIEASIERATKCITDGQSELGGGSGLDAGQEYKLSSAQEDIEEIKGKLAKGEEVSTTDCVSVTMVIDAMATVDNADVKAVITEGGQLCSHDAPLARVTAWKAEVEAGAAKGGLNSACFDVNKTTLAELVTAYPEDADVKAINDYVQATCPK